MNLLPRLCLKFMQKIEPYNQNKLLVFSVGFNWIPKFSVKFIACRCFCTKKSRVADPQRLCRNPTYVYKAQNTLVEYFQFTSGLEYIVSQRLSKKSPLFLSKLLLKVGKDEDGIEKALSRFLRYHPPNEYELFFESIGLNPLEFSSLLPRDSMFLKDDPKMLYNYRVLCNYGIVSKNIGKIYKDAIEVFRYEKGILASKLQAYENLKLSKTTVIKIVASSPRLLIGDISKDFVNFLEVLTQLGIEQDWLEGVLYESNTYHWGKMPVLIHSCLQIGLTTQEVGILIRMYPSILLDGSGKIVTSLIVFLLKVLGTKVEIISLLKESPQINFMYFIHNLRLALRMLTYIEMEPLVVQKLMRSHLYFFGLNRVKKPSSIISELSIGKRRLCRIIEDDPNQLKNFVRGRKLKRLPNIVDVEKTNLMKREFLLGLGFAADSKDMKKILNQCRGKADDFQERFNYLIKRGLDASEVSHIIIRFPSILNQTTDTLDQKINFLVTNWGAPLNLLASFPQYLAFTIQRIKVRFLMYTWLKDRKKVGNIRMATVLTSSDVVFRQRYINRHPEGPKMWEEFMNLCYTN